ncbi:TIGR03364 family FAD-dependent oxidoreductase [Luteipulveratus mongoliensis]|uniref:Oxidoreductase n=1 Tax=Luteipulveratus mongoliensis TaxID=571913 RepID=A0A0K1JEF0_9MICO|nr:TIGR03364 family FAD-dependent oxidoreductase [Luteipulveratus mongoliensis]AKU15092.1 oxidoreductase [Luteipulveratus mongoliensis]
MTSSATVDLAIVGAGIVGLAHAVEAVDRGLSVAVIERDDRATGASVRNFGHGCVTAQAGPTLAYGTAARLQWLRLAKEAGLWLRDSGTLVAARADDELAVLTELHDQRGDDVVLLDRATVHDRADLADDVVGGAWLPLDIRVDPREAPAAIARWLTDQGVTFHWGTALAATEPGVVRTSRGAIRAHRTVVAVGHDLDHVYPDLTERHGVRRCRLRMLRVADPHSRTLDPALLTGHSMLRYGGFDTCPTLPALRARLEREEPEAVRSGLNLMFTQRPDGSLTIGDTHHYDRTLDPFDDEDLDELVLSQTARLLGVPRLQVLQRWRGVYASAPEPFLIDTPHDDARAVAVTSGVGMTTAFGLAAAVLDDLL